MRIASLLIQPQWAGVNPPFVIRFNNHIFLAYILCLNMYEVENRQRILAYYAKIEAFGLREIVFFVST